MRKRSGWSSRVERDFASVLEAVSFTWPGAFSLKRRVLESFERIALAAEKDPFLRREYRRRVTEHLLDAATRENWETAKPFFRRMLRVGFSGPDRIVLAAFWLSRVARSSDDAREQCSALVARAERALRRADVPTGYRDQELAVLDRIRAALDARG